MEVCGRCGAELYYSAPDVNMLHRGTNDYFCADQRAKMQLREAELRKERAMTWRAQFDPQTYSHLLRRP